MEDFSFVRPSEVAGRCWPVERVPNWKLALLERRRKQLRLNVEGDSAPSNCVAGDGAEDPSTDRNVPIGRAPGPGCAVLKGLGDAVQDAKLRMQRASDTCRVGSNRESKAEAAKTLGEYVLAKRAYDDFRNKSLALPTPGGVATFSDMCRSCGEPNADYRVTYPCGHQYHRDCASESSHRVCCGNAIVTAVAGRFGLEQKPLVRARDRVTDVNTDWQLRGAYWRGLRMVAFPVMYLGLMRVWVVSTRRPADYEYDDLFVSVGDHRVYGVVPTPAFIERVPTIKADLYMYQVDIEAFKQGRLVHEQATAPIRGLSCLAALHLADHGTFVGFSSVLLTGSVEGSRVVAPDEGVFASKLKQCRAHGLLLASASSHAAVEIYDLSLNYHGIRVSVDWESDLRAFAADDKVATRWVRRRRNAPPPVLAVVEDEPPAVTAPVAVVRPRGTRVRTPVMQLVQTSGNKRDGSPKVSLDDFNKLQRDYKAARTQTQNLAKQVRANAMTIPNAPMVATGKSRVLRNILLPDEGAISIPGFDVRPHFLKAETITANVTSNGLGGIFFVYPESPDSNVAAHYVQSRGGYVFDQWITTAQDLKDSFDYGKRGSCLLTLRSSTVPSGQFALNGTFNAARVEGTISEIPGLNEEDLYSTILTNTTEPLDKVGNVLVGDGVAILAISGGLGQRFTRLGDAPPYDVDTGFFQTHPPRVNDRTDDLQYQCTAGYITALPHLNTTKFLGLLMNVDSTTGIELGLTFKATSLLEGEYGLAFQLFFYDPFGNQIYEQEYNLNLTTDNEFELFASIKDFIDIASYNLGPLGSIRINGSITVPVDVPEPILNTTLSYVVPNGAKYGVNMPVVPVAYTGVSSGTTITLSGWANFNLIPNPSLRENVRLVSGTDDPNDLHWAKIVLSNRADFLVRSVWSCKEYMMSRETLAELCDVNVHKRASALSMSDVLSGLKDFFKPVAQTLLNKGADALIGLAASGSAIMPRALRDPMIGSSPLAMAASGDIILPRPLDMPGSVKLPFTSRMGMFDARAMAADGVVAFAADGPLNVAAVHNRKSLRRVIRPRVERTVAFPVLLTHHAVAGTLGSMLYVASNINFAKWRPETRVRRGAFMVQGTDTLPNVPLAMNIFLCPIDPKRFPNIVPIDGPPVSGHSCDGAIWLVQHGSFTGVLPFAVTGSVNGFVLAANDHFADKLLAMRADHVPLAGNDETADVPLEDLRAVRSDAADNIYVAQ